MKIASLRGVCRTFFLPHSILAAPIVTALVRRATHLLNNSNWDPEYSHARWLLAEVRWTKLGPSDGPHTDMSKKLKDRLRDPAL